MNNTTELVFILDRSGSMHGLEADTVGGFNSMLDKQKQEEGTALVTTILFDTRITRLHDRLPLEQVERLSDRDYVPGGCTALLDAVGSTIKHIAQIHRYARPEDVPGKTVFVIMTDGLENASRLFSQGEVKRLIEHEKSKYGWEFLFLGANIDAVETAGGLGISQTHAANFHADGMGIEMGFEAMTRAVRDLRCSMPFSPSWKEDVEADYERRR